ncbi:MAG: hypothetical protein ABIN91_14020 [Mucilaginibacter sp.]
MMNDHQPLKRNVTPEKAVKILAKHGNKITLEEAKLILDFIYDFANLSVKQVLRGHHNGEPPKVISPRKLYR